LKKAIQEQLTAILEQHIIFLSNIFYVEIFEEDIMYGFKFGWIVPVIVLFVLFTVIGVGIYQLNSDGNPWYLESNTNSGWGFLSKK
jgi:hypothetical protein